MTEHKNDDDRGASRSDAGLGWTLYDNIEQAAHPLACAVRDNAKAEMLRLRYLVDIAYDHLLHCGYREEDPTLTKLREGLSPNA